MPLEYRLLQFEKVSSLIAIIGAVLLYISASKAQVIEIEQAQGIQTNSTEISPSQITAIAERILLIGRTLSAIIAKTRLKEREQQVILGKNTAASLEPNILINNGHWIVVLGTIIIAIGTQKRANQGAQITIV
ncbi:MAG: hypothetical protein Q8936_12260 [Bacillota bacterium]|nr:hypothetical protein [Bacillota bacterium]